MEDRRPKNWKTSTEIRILPRIIKPKKIKSKNLKNRNGLTEGSLSILRISYLIVMNLNLLSSVFGLPSFLKTKYP
ncbi:hypothetical protein AO498_11835 [Algoriphagus sanaruensis]|uniref:Uncharacterized protein n=1 Tax=Algoriphagus sanaruensis TaxID=1727163 RepID=A0A142EPS5_9BACT|nr:hypothetical protein AO498_11835 [Algoriphagus sanaruensis]